LQDFKAFSFSKERPLYLAQEAIDGIWGDIVFSDNLLDRGVRKISLSKDFDNLVNSKFSLSHNNLLQ